MQDYLFIFLGTQAIIFILRCLTAKIFILIKVLKVLLGVERKKNHDTEKVRSLTCMEKKSSELNYSLSFFSLLQVEDVFFTSFY